MPRGGNNKLRGSKGGSQGQASKQATSDATTLVMEKKEMSAKMEDEAAMPGLADAMCGVEVVATKLEDGCLASCGVSDVDLPESSFVPPAVSEVRAPPAPVLTTPAPPPAPKPTHKQLSVAKFLITHFDKPDLATIEAEFGQASAGEPMPAATSMDKPGPPPPAPTVPNPVPFQPAPLVTTCAEPPHKVASQTSSSVKAVVQPAASSDDPRRTEEPEESEVRPPTFWGRFCGRGPRYNRALDAPLLQGWSLKSPNRAPEAAVRLHAWLRPMQFSV